VAVSNLGLRNPLHVAEDYAMVDVLSGGRLTLGVGSGYLPHEFAGMRASLEDKRERFDENFAVLREALSGNKVTFQGKYNDIPGVALNVGPVQHPEPPMYVAIRRQEAAYHVGRQGHRMFSLPCTCLDSFEEIRSLVGQFREGYRASGGNTPDVVLAFHTHVAESDEAAKRRAEEALNRYFDTRLAYKTRQDYDMVLGKGLAMLGSAQTVAGKLRELQAMGVDHVMFLQNFGCLAPEAVSDSMRRLAADVIPQVSAA
ncbi:MAG: LLM class flavin-dependent oxidoreductase, partial [Burkholderiales bacterium]|nr:LLM class flavin-dependent oxidoreductase [Burkholderiales bacterium]